MIFSKEYRSMLYYNAQSILDRRTCQNKNADFENDLIKKLVGGQLTSIDKQIDAHKIDIQRNCK